MPVFSRPEVMVLFGLSLWGLCSVCAGLQRHQDEAAPLPDTMQRSFVVGPHFNCCGGVGDLGVHASVDAMEGCCSPHFERIQIQTVARPGPKQGHALVRVGWSSVNPSNWKRFVVDPVGFFVPGKDFAGVVAEVGEGCDFAPGEPVWGRIGGSYQEYINVPCSEKSDTGRVPPGMSLQQAGVLGVTGTTAYGSLRWAGAPWKTSPTVLVIGGSSGTGHVGIQLAKAWGAAKVITTASANNSDFVKSVGADVVVDYHKANWWEVLQPGTVDVIYDCVCLHGTGDHAYEVLADGGAFVTIQSQSEASKEAIRSRPSIRHLHHTGLPSDRAELQDLGNLVSKGQLASTIAATYPLHQVSEAFKESMRGHAVGKIAIRI